MKQIDEDKLGKVQKKRLVYEKEYGLFKFRIFPFKDIINLLGLNGEVNLLKKILSVDLEKYYSELSPPKENEWLMTHKEYGQTYAEYTRSNYRLLTPNKNVLYLMNIKVIEKMPQVIVKNMEKNKEVIQVSESIVKSPIESDIKEEPGIKQEPQTEIKPDVDMKTEVKQEREPEIYIKPYDAEYINCLISILKEYFPQINIKAINYTIEVSEFDLVYNSYQTDPEHDTERKFNGCYLLSCFFKKKTNLLPKDSYGAILLMGNDMYHIKKDNQPEFCYELCNVNKNIAILSPTRFHPLFYYTFIRELIDGDKQKIIIQVTFKRTLKLIIRNICLMFGLSNCIFLKCLLNGFNYINEFDNNPIELCPMCLRKIYSVILTDKDDIQKSRKKNSNILYQRFQNLNNLLSGHIHKEVFAEEIKWYNKRYQDLLKII